MANISDSALTVLADEIQDETTAGANTATRVGTFLNDLVDSKVNNDQVTNRTLYTFGVTQVGASAPTVTEYLNQLSGALVWTRSSTGVYIGTLAGAFTNYTIPLIEGVIKNGTTTSSIKTFSLEKTSSNVITLSTFTNAVAADSVLTAQYFELPLYAS